MSLTTKGRFIREVVFLKDRLYAVLFFALICIVLFFMYFSLKVHILLSLSILLLTLALTLTYVFISCGRMFFKDIYCLALETENQDEDISHDASLMLAMMYKAKREGLLEVEDLAGKFNLDILSKGWHMLIDSLKVKEISLGMRRLRSVKNFKYLKCLRDLREITEVLPIIGVVLTLSLILINFNRADFEIYKLKYLSSAIAPLLYTELIAYFLVVPLKKIIRDTFKKNNTFVVSSTFVITGFAGNVDRRLLELEMKKYVKNETFSSNKLLHAI